MRIFTISCFLVFNAIFIKANEYIDSLVSQLSVSQKVELLFIQQPDKHIPDSLLLANHYPIFDIRKGKTDALELSFPSEYTIRTVHKGRLINRLFASELKERKRRGYAALAVSVTGKGAQLYIGTQMNSNPQEQLRIIDFPVDVYNALMLKAKYQIEPRKEPVNFQFKELGLPALDIWKTAEQPVGGLNDFMQSNWLYWESGSSCKQQVEEAVDLGLISEEMLDMKVKRILRLMSSRSYSGNEKDNSNILTLLREQVYRSSIAIYQRANIFPIVHLDTVTISIHNVSDSNVDEFHKKTKFYKSNQHPKKGNSHIHFFLCDDAKKIDVTRLVEADTTSVHAYNVLVYAGNIKQYELSGIVDNIDAIVMMPEYNKLSWGLLAQAVFNGIDVDGVSVLHNYLGRNAFNRVVLSKNRIGFKQITAGNLPVDSVAKIDSIVNDAIRRKATPGAQLIVVKKGDVLVQKSYGHHTYQKRKKVRNDDLYDVASVTKLAVTFPIVMQLYEKNILDLDATLDEYIPEIDTTDKADITIRELLLHQSGLTSYIPFHTNAIEQKSLGTRSLYSRHYTRLYNIRVDTRLYQNRAARYRKDVFANEPDSIFSLRLSQKMFMNENYVDSMYATIYSSSLHKKEYRYSDLGYYLLQKIIEKEVNENLDSVFYKQISSRLAGGRLVYCPLNTFSADDVVPTENDLAFRKEQLHGYVHDQGAAMLGGVAAHAGLFSNAGDLAKLTQMLLNEGDYGGWQFLKPETIGLFTKTSNHGNRRGLGVDKPELEPSKNSHVSKLASSSSYGHTGFTGTIVWVDPEYELIYIFLSNRIHPRAYNKKLIELNVRTQIQDVIYNSLKY